MSRKVKTQAFDFEKIEKKWRDLWLKNKIYKAEDFDSRPKFYMLNEFPYPSGEGLHMGHFMSYTAGDVYARYKRMQGYNVLFPMGWDAFGLPTYNYAIKVGKDPFEVTKENIANFKRQLMSLGASFDWDREINTTDPKYYKWTQWIFIQLYEHWYDPEYKRADGGEGKARHISELPIPEEVKVKGEKAIKDYQDKYRLAYKAKMPVYYCPFCKSAVANEEVDPDGTHERCHQPVEVRELEQWILRITAYADRLIEDLDLVDYLDSIKRAQINWIGRKYGALVKFKIADTSEVLEVYTTRPDTIFGVTFVVVSPESEFVKNYLDKMPNKEKVEQYSKRAIVNKAVLAQDKAKDGVFTGLYVIHPFTGERIPVWVSRFVLADYGTGAIMGVPAHDQRDFEFAKEHNLPIKWVVKPKTVSLDKLDKTKAFTEKENTEIINSDFLNGLDVKTAIEKAIKVLEGKGLGVRHKTYHLRDWIFSRQHYWGEPTPMVYCEKCGWNPVPVEELPVELPHLKDYKMAEDGTSPLQKAEEWRKTTCPVCKEPAVRETDVMPNWAGSNWYYLRYVDPHNSERLVAKNKAEYWMPVDLYDGGAEHNTLHLLYSRFIYKFLYDIGVAPTPEPYQRRITHGVILGPDGRKMSKSRGNVINPDEVIATYGADIVRTYVMFMGPHDGTLTWSEESLVGVKRFIERVYNYVQRYVENKDSAASLQDLANKQMKIALNKLGKKVGDYINSVKFNTAVAAIMEFFNEFEDTMPNHENVKTFIKILAPFIPYLAEEMWSQIGEEFSVHLQSWPKYDPNLDKEAEVEVPVQVNGKVRGKLIISKNTPADEVQTRASQLSNVSKYLEGKKIVKVIYVPGKIINIIAK